MNKIHSVFHQPVSLGMTASNRDFYVSTSVDSAALEQQFKSAPCQPRTRVREVSFQQRHIRFNEDSMSVVRPFHIAFPVDDLAAARNFYGRILGCPEGRSSEQWIDFNLYGHQIVAHLKPRDGDATHSNPVDGHDVPVPHFGVILTQDDWQSLAERVQAAGVPFVIEPYTRFKGEVGEQSTMFFLDPAGNALEFKAFADLDQIFAK